VRVGIIGFGSIGREVARGVHDGLAGDATLVGALVRNERVPEHDIQFLRTLDELLAQAPDFIIEAASPEAVSAYAEPILGEGISLVIASGSALMDAPFRGRLERICTQHGSRVYVPSGALAGMDALRALAGRSSRVALRVTEPAAVTDELVFRGDAPEAIRRYPSRLNVAATALLASGSAVQVELRRAAGRREIEIVVESEFGDFSAHMHPTPASVALSLVGTLRRLQQPIAFG
jgi:aspartate dehydrogenase